MDDSVKVPSYASLPEAERAAIDTVAFKRSEMDPIVLAMLENQMRLVITAHTPPEGVEAPEESKQQLVFAEHVLQRLQATAFRGGVVEDMTDPLDAVIRTTRSQVNADDVLSALGETSGVGAQYEPGDIVHCTSVTGKVLSFLVKRIDTDGKVWGYEVEETYSGAHGYGPKVWETTNHEEVLLPSLLFGDREQAIAEAKRQAEWRKSVTAPGGGEAEC